MRTSLLLVSLLGCAQALFLATALAFRPVNRRASRLLAVMLIAMAVYLGNGVYLAAKLVAQWPVFFGWSHPTPLLFGPLLYLYAIHATDADRKWHWYDWLHFAPALVVLLWSIPVYTLPAAEKVALYEAIGDGVVPPSVATNLQVAYWLRMISGVVYTACTVLVVRAHRVAIRRQFSTLDRVTLDWLLLLAGASVIVWMVVVLARLVEPAGWVPAGTGDYIIAMVLAVLTYLVGYRGLQQSEMHRPMPEPVVATTDADEPAPADVRTDRALMTPGMANALERRLHEMMEQEKPWQDPELTLGSLAERLNTSTHKLSDVLNGRVEQNFHDYVNAFRVREVQRQLIQPGSVNRTVLSIALDAGFASKSTFNAVFRKQTGMTPSAWRDAQGQRPSDSGSIS
ncbi:MAG: AraC family transcriptional regulator [Gemmatimonadaceae bacterium]|nr:AraC family transcriptional regulator [Gemmatimonadaceae bacterium]